MNWKESNTGLSSVLIFENQTELAKFVLCVARISDDIQHHADMVIKYNALELNLITHDEGRITEKDQDLLKRIVELWEINYNH